MMKRIDLKSLCAGILLGAAAVFTIAATTNADAKPLEYRIVFGQILGGELERKLNGSTVDGWELVETVSFRELQGFAVMSRPKQ